MAKGKWYRIAVEGATATDGRSITAQMIQEAAAAYNRDTYTARLNCEHIRGFSPQPPFNAYGDVAALKAEETEITIDGKPAKKQGLFAQIEPNAQLIAVNRAGQKKFTSCEFAPDFAKTGKFGLVGLGITDSPASLGTEALSFSALKPMWDSRKTDPANFFSAAEEVAFDFADEGNAGMVATIKTAVGEALAKFTGKTEETKKEDKPADPPQGGSGAAFDVAAYSAVIGEQIAAAVGKAEQSANSAITALSAKFDALTEQLGKTEDKRFNRAPASGGTGGDVVATDC